MVGVVTTDTTTAGTTLFTPTVEPNINSDYIFTFGKFRGRNVQYVLDHQPSYISWAAETIPSFIPTEEIMMRARSNKNTIDCQAPAAVDPDYVFGDYGDLFD